ncbi:MAG TPA: GGDEF domain-containing protein [Solirubrobacteraceae bacterium]|nr:GGDEF domain-containing protein [Solirubrobacteraceae bacterium]
MGTEPRLSWLCRDEAQRDRVVDMERRLRPARAATMALLLAALVVVAPWQGWWTLAPLAGAGALVLAAERGMDRRARPELGIAVAWAVGQVAIALAVALSGGPESPAVSWLAIPVVTLSARFDRRGVLAGLAFTAVLVLATTVGVDPGAVGDDPSRAVLPLALVGAVGLLSTALMRSDLADRTASVLDGLTGMLSRRSLAARAAELEQQAALTGQAVGLVLGDLDRFEAINDEHGHQAGDAVLVDVAATLRKELRAFDLAYRLDGEQFLVVLPGASLDDTLALAERLRVAVELEPAGGLPVTMSFGVASSAGRALRWDRLLAQADAALHEAKGGGRNRVSGAGSPPRAA